MHSPLAHIHPRADIGENVTIDPFVVVEEDVIIGDGTHLHAHAVVMNGARLGRNCQIFPGAVIAAVPQDLKFKGEKTTVEIGDNVIIREYATLNRGTVYADKTSVNDNTLIMAYAHVAHDCVIGRNCIVANSVNLAGHIRIDDFAIIGGSTAVHQFVRIGKHSFVGGGSLVRKDVPPFVKAAREPISYVGVNAVGLKRRGFTQESVNLIQDTYRILFVNGNSTTKALELIGGNIPESAERDDITEFIRASKRGIMRGYRVN